MAPTAVWICFSFAGECMLEKASSLFVFGLIPPAETCPRHSNSSWKNLHFAMLIFRPAFTSVRWTIFRCSSWSLENMVMSSNYTRVCLYMGACRRPSINLWKVDGAFFKTKGITRHWLWLLATEKAILGLSRSSKGIWRYPDCRSIEVRAFENLTQSWEKRWVLLCVTEFRFL